MPKAPCVDGLYCPTQKVIACKSRHSRHQIKLAHWHDSTDSPTLGNMVLAYLVVCFEYPLSIQSRAIRAMLSK